MIAWPDIGHALADRGDRAGSLAADDEGNLRGAVRADALPLVHVHVIDAGGGDPDRELPGTWRQVAPVLDAQYLGAAEPLDHHSAHVVTSSL
jgi:hypothetical protein